MGDLTSAAGQEHGAGTPGATNGQALSWALAPPLRESTLKETMFPDGIPQLSTTDGAVLGLVALSPSSGYDLARLAEQSVGYLWAPSRSQIYKVLPRLVARGFARARSVPQDDRPDKRVYKITPAGRSVLHRWLEEVDDPGIGESNVFALKLFFCDLVPVHAAEAQLAGYRRFLEFRLSRFESMLRSLDDVEAIFPQLILRRAITRIRATLVWVDEAEGAITLKRGGALQDPDRDRPGADGSRRRQQSRALGHRSRATRA